MTEKIVGNCGKHPGQSMINCPLCTIERQKAHSKENIPQYKLEENKKLVDEFTKLFEPKEKYHAVEYAGYWKIQEGQFYGDKDILDAEDVGQKQAEKNAKLIAQLLNQLNQPS